MVVRGVRVTTARGSAPNGEAVLVFGDLDAQPAEAFREHRDAIALLDAKLLRAAHRHRDARLHGRERRKTWDLVDQPRHLLGNDLERLRRAVADADGAYWFPGLLVPSAFRRNDVDPCARPPQHVEHRTARGVQPDPFDYKIGIGRTGREDEPEDRRRDIARDGRVDGAEVLAPVD